MIPGAIALAKTAFAWITQGGHWKWAVGAAVCLTMGVLVWQVRSSHRNAEALRTALDASEGEVLLLRQARQADALAMASRSAARTTIMNKEAQKSAELDKALSVNEDWANTPVPDTVIDSLRD